jgi:ACDE family multidrug resistance protein
MTASSGTRATLWLVVAAATLTVMVGAILGPVVAFGLGLGLVFPSAFAWIEALAPQDRQGQYSSYLASAGYVGQFAASIVFGPLVAPFGVRGVFGAAATVATVAAVALVGGLLGRR